MTAIPPRVHDQPIICSDLLLIIQIKKGANEPRSAAAIAETINVAITSRRKFRATNPPPEMRWTWGEGEIAEKAGGERRILTVVIWGQSPETNAVTFIFLRSEANR
jgi:hypothetical protein